MLPRGYSGSNHNVAVTIIGNNEFQMYFEDKGKIISHRMNVGLEMLNKNPSMDKLLRRNESCFCRCWQENLGHLTS